MIIGQVLDSHLRCPRDGKRLLLEVGQEDFVEGPGIGALAMVHVCTNCGYREQERDWTRPSKVARELAAARLARRRLEGWTHEIQYDTTPWPEEEWSDA